MSNLDHKFAAFIGLDWANDKHDVCLQVGPDTKRTFQVVKHTPEALDEWLNILS
ncbi:hypothetical protein AADZ86_15225 [Colwelliaceae bacterium BS250]